jgi:hypothetical protein
MKILRVVLALALLPVASFASTIFTWDFEAGGAAFASDYTSFTQTSPPVELPEGNYAVTKDAKSVHDLLATFGDHTTGSGYMMVVNAATAPNKAVWRADLGSTDLLTGMSYALSFWVAGVYGLDYSPAELWVSVDGVNVNGGSYFAPSGVGVWNEFTVRFNAPSARPDIRIIDNNLTWRGNDFALDDVTLHQPEPSAWMMGIGGVAAMLLLRRRRRS